MPYTPTTWVDRAVATPNKYTKSGETSTEVTLVQAPGTITQAGTPLNATNLNAMETGIDQAHDNIDAHVALQTTVHGSTSAATANTLMHRDASGRVKVAAPSATDDVAIKSTVDDAVTTHNAVTNPHSATSAATASRLVLRDASGRAQFADPSAAADAATKSYADGLISVGTYTGDGTTARTISLSKTPKYVIIRGNTTYNNASANMKYETQHTNKGYIFGTAGSFDYVNVQVGYPRITTNGFIVDTADANNDLANKNTIVFDYIAFY